ncbi:MAG: hypothetical protein FK731_02040, partial [Asgard group archaeon]|nr:hypothetical protein [Asgard group archaeon]
MGNEGKVFFNTAVTITLVGLLFYFVEDLIIWIKYLEPGNIIQYGMPITIVISDVIMMITLIMAMILLFVGFDKTKIFRSTIMMGGVYLLVYTMGHIFMPFYAYSGWTIPSFYGANIVRFFAEEFFTSFICLLLLGCVSLFIIILSIIKMKEEQFTVEEKFSYILTLGIMVIFDIACLHWAKALVREEIGIGFAIIPYYGFLHIPFIFEMMLLIAIILLIVANLFNRGNGYLEVMTLIILNILFITIISTAVVGSVLDFTISNDLIPLALGNSLILLGTVLTFISSIILVK